MRMGLAALGQGESQRGFLLCHKSEADGIWVSWKRLGKGWGCNGDTGGIRRYTGSSNEDDPFYDCSIARNHCRANSGANLEPEDGGAFGSSSTGSGRWTADSVD